jgi:hypothetical protein
MNALNKNISPCNEDPEKKIDVLWSYFAVFTYIFQLDSFTRISIVMFLTLTALEAFSQLIAGNVSVFVLKLTNIASDQLGRRL